MENASKALLMAGGILFAIIILSLFLYMATVTTRIGDVQESKTLAKQITAFNKEYEAYNRRRLYGTDVITVVNKAINHNKTIKAEVTDPYYINITIVPAQNFETIVEEINNTKPDYVSKELKGNQITAEIKEILGNPNNSYSSYLEAGMEEELGVWHNNGKDFVMNGNFVQFFAGDAIDKTEETTDGETTYKMYSALTNFKRAIFICPEDGVQYNQETGRIESMKFIQKSI